ncbi:hypothetical protein BKA57DRAFT_445975 [Linnemannia elongata]|nr:hypothetical protein BKA57DRAFT_445975 [Linnemannia elongata]
MLFLSHPSKQHSCYGPLSLSFFSLPILPFVFFFLPLRSACHDNKQHRAWSIGFRLFLYPMSLCFFSPTDAPPSLLVPSLSCSPSCSPSFPFLSPLSLLFFPPSYTFHSFYLFILFLSSYTRLPPLGPRGRKMDLIHIQEGSWWMFIGLCHPQHLLLPILSLISSLMTKVFGQKRDLSNKSDNATANYETVWSLASFLLFRSPGPHSHMSQEAQANAI